MTSMTVSVPDALGEWIQSRIASGRYASASDYVADLISRDRIATEDEDRWLAELDASIARGVEDSKAGRGEDADKVFDRLEAKYSAMVAAIENH
jgi:antitoxin ParD1/3/4